MLTRIYIDNFRCFVNFEYKPGRRQLILGPNGAGKSSLLDALLFLRRFLVFGHDLEKHRILNERTLWMEQSVQTFELEAKLDGGTYTYHLGIDSYGDPPRPRVLSERVTRNAKSIFEFEKGRVHLFDEEFKHKVDYPFDWHRSALATITDSRVNRDLNRFKTWFNNLFCFRINPFNMFHQAEEEDSYPYFELMNFTSWYRHLVQTYPKENADFLDSLRTVLDGFSVLKLERAGENVRVLAAEFTYGKNVRLALNQLSDGQRCLIGLYAILHFVLTKGNTVIVDEPDNFISLREIQPWLNAVADAIEENKGQILIISHHPEFMNQWAPSVGVRFVRDGMGPVHVKEFHVESDSALLPSEVIARGWENE